MIQQTAVSIRIRKNRNSTRWCCTASVQNVGKDPAYLRDLPFTFAIWSQFTSDCLWASMCLSKVHEEVKRVAMNKVSQEHKLEYSPCNEKCKHAKTHATCRYRRTGNISLVKNHVTG